MFKQGSYTWSKDTEAGIYQEGTRVSGGHGSGAMGKDFLGSSGKLVNKICSLMQDPITGTQENKRNQSPHVS